MQHINPHQSPEQTQKYAARLYAYASRTLEIAESSHDDLCEKLLSLRESRSVANQFWSTGGALVRAEFIIQHAGRLASNCESYDESKPDEFLLRIERFREMLFSQFTNSSTNSSDISNGVEHHRRQAAIRMYEDTRQRD